MSMNPLNDISTVYLKEVLKPQLGKGAPEKKESGSEKPSAEGGEKKEGDASAGSAKRIRQAVYDIRYRARREEIPVQQAYNQYMSHTTMTGPEKSEVKSKLGEEKVYEELEEKKFQVRVTDKNSGKSYVRMATREKINQLRSNSNISSVEMTKYGSPYEGEKKKGKATADVTSGKGLAKAGKDYDGDGKVESGAKEYRGSVHNAIQRKKGGKPDGQDTSSVKEGFSNWRDDLYEVVSEIEDKKKAKIKERKVENKIVINPPLKESIENLGGQLLEVEELDEGVRPGNVEKPLDKAAFKKRRRSLAGKEKSADARARGHEGKTWADSGRTYSPDEAKSRRANMSNLDRSQRYRVANDPDSEHDDYPASKTKNPKKLRKQSAMGEETIIEKAPPGAKFERMVKHIKKGYAKDGGLTDKEKSIAYATAWKAKNKMSEAMDTTTGVSKEPSKTQSVSQDAQRKQQIQQLRTMMMKKRQLQNQELSLQKQGKLPVDTHATEEVELNGEIVDEARAEEKRGYGSTGAQRQRQKKGVVTSMGQVAYPKTSYSGGQNPHLRGKGGGTKEQRRERSRRYVDQPGGIYAKPENKQGEGRYAAMQYKKRDQSHMSSRFD